MAAAVWRSWVFLAAWWCLLAATAYEVRLRDVNILHSDIVLGGFQGAALSCDADWDADVIFCSRAALNASSGGSAAAADCAVSRRDACNVETVAARVGYLSSFSDGGSPAHVLGLVLRDEVVQGGALDFVGEPFDPEQSWAFASPDFRSSGVSWGLLEEMFTEQLPFERADGPYAPRFLFLHKKLVAAGQYKFLHGVHCYDEIQAYVVDTTTRYCCEIFNPRYNEVPFPSAADFVTEQNFARQGNLQVEKRCVDIPQRAFQPNSAPLRANSPCGYLSSSVALCKTTGSYGPPVSAEQLSTVPYELAYEPSGADDGSRFSCVYHCRFPCVTVAAPGAAGQCARNGGFGSPVWGTSESDLAAVRDHQALDLTLPFNSYACPGRTNAVERNYDQRLAVCTHDVSSDPTFFFGCRDRASVPVARSAANPGATCGFGELGCSRPECRCLNGCPRAVACSGRGTLWHDLDTDSGFCVCDAGFLGRKCQFEDLQSDLGHHCHHGQPLKPLEYQLGP
jgi:hypothetical protein